MYATFDPLVAPPPKEVPLPNAPLVRVIARISFPAIVSIGKVEFIAPFQEAIRSAYPVLRPEQTVVFAVGPIGNAPPQTTWRFSDVAGEWRVSLAPNFVAVETTKYVSRTDFVERLELIIGALAKHINPQTMDRIGVRYIDRLKGEALRNLSKYVRPEVIGILATDAAKHVEHAIAESLFMVPNKKAQLMARWGRLPAGATVDPAAVEPIDEASWLLDVDMFCTEPGPFSTKLVLSEYRAYSERIYTFFRWAVSDEFLKLCGGQA